MNTTVVDVSPGLVTTCAQTAAGPMCWGDNYFGQLGDSTTDSRDTPTAVVSLETTARPSTGSFHACALSGGQILCWGDNSFGQLGIGTFSVSVTPVEVAFPSP
jgi:serine/threonine-protein kinase